MIFHTPQGYNIVNQILNFSLNLRAYVSCQGQRGGKFHHYKIYFFLPTLAMIWK
jgi:hypothetical protein